MNRGLVVVDLQNEYLPTGKLPLTDIEHAAANALRVITHARDAGIPIFHVRHESVEGAPIFAKGTAGAKIQSAVAPVGDEPVIVKKHINAFRETDLKQQLDALDIQEIVVIGAMSHMCIDALVRAAVDMGYAVTVLHDACATLDLTFGGVSVPAAQAHATIMAAFEFGYATVKPVDEYLSA
ncbi:cysteine hydrolase [Pseudomonas frederiksbergensis]|jgi:nicotinamidase-related amidase|uniref:cysteine hydrolase family protein n=1 Tax=Pseudomonas TaxID=286 RepID=UPI0013A089B3|nr:MULTISPECIES: cysteine hydrolase family protein [Pseudomonas]QIB03752.1 cysteine hydrolase [Pseudomonas fluorescens]URM25786.1 cysteine hydrolase [Pseudomonas frederiksbergensis]WLG70334.1 cysteine hydrolase family protein [Pseudomonas brassicacearum]WLI15208.1 cysteine hydrolase family protein [Pseudomonas sp. FP603]WNZ76501.1 cysteine hydrolase family protein [Pseudomonas sp. P105]